MYDTRCWGKGEPDVRPGGANADGGGCSASDLDAILHRAPKAYYDDISERALGVIWNPTNTSIT